MLGLRRPGGGGVMSLRYDASCDCGFTTSSTYRSYVERALRMHSCAKWVEKIAGQQRRAARLAAVDRTPKPCLHKQADHQHGTRACYVLDRCRCLPCSRANSEAETGRERQKAYGRYDKYLDAEPVRAHVRSLMAQGMGWKRQAIAAGVSPSSMWKLLYGKRQPDGSQEPSRRITRANAERLLAVTLDLAGGAVVDHTGTTRRVQALVALGWSQAKLGQRLGIDPTNMGPLAHGARETTVATAKAVRDLYDELSMQLPPAESHRDKIAASRARNYARAHGWLPPLAWDDELIDDPAHTPLLERGPSITHDDELDDAAIWRRMHGDRTVRLSKADAAEVVRRWAASGRSLADCERVTGIKADRWYRLKDQEAAS